MTTAEKSRPAQLADEIEALGWKVERVKAGVQRAIVARRGADTVRIAFVRTATAGAVQGVKDVFAGAEHWHGDTRTELAGIPPALKIVKALPFALDAPDDVVLAAVAGHSIRWTSRLTDKVQGAVVPRGGVHLKLISGNTAKGPIAPEDRVLHFTDTLGFHAVRIGAIVEVK